MRTSLLAGLMALGLVGSAAAQDSTAVKPERPTVATHAYVITPGFVELEAGAVYRRPDRATVDVPVYVKFGVTPWLQLGVGPSFGFNHGGTGGDLQGGPADLAVAAKVVVGTHLPIVNDFAIQPSVKFATGSTGKGLGTGTTDAGILLVSSHPVLGGQVDANVGFTFRSGGGDDVPETASVWAVAFGRPISGPLGGVAEVFGYPGTSGPAGGPPQVGLLFGPTWALRPSLVLDAGAIVNLQHLGGNAAYVGLTANLGRWFGR